MVFLYPLGEGSMWADMELNLSISALKKHCTEDFRVIVVGSAPKIKGDFEFISNKHNGSRYQNAISNLIKGAEAINAPFILMNDDFFCLRQFKEIPLYYDGTIKDRIRTASSFVYRKALEKSIKKVTDLNFAVHLPMPINDLNLFQYSALKALELNCSLRNIYGNLIDGKKEQIKDLKINNLIDLGNRTWFSISDKFLKDNKQWLIENMTHDTSREL